MRKYLVLDIGGTTIKCGLMNEKAEILKRKEVLTPLDSIDNLLEKISELYNEVKDSIVGIAISMPGIIEPESGFCHTGGALEYIKKINFVNVLEKRCPLPITIGNDAKCAANAEIGFGNLRNVDDAVVIVLGTAIGGCLVKNRQIIYGKNLMSGEFSFIQVNGLENDLSFSNTWASQSGVQGLLNLIQTFLETDETFTGREIFEMANKGNEKVLKALEVFAKRIAFQILNIQAIYDPEKFVIGGGISTQPMLIKMINSQLMLLIKKCPVYFPLPIVEPCKYGNDSNLVGALYQHMKKFEH